MMGRSPRCYIPIFVKIGPPVMEKKILDLVNMNRYTKFGQTLSPFFLMRKMMVYNPNLDLIDINVYTKFG